MFQVKTFRCGSQHLLSHPRVLHYDGYQRPLTQHRYASLPLAVLNSEMSLIPKLWLLNGCHLREVLFEKSLTTGVA